MFGMFGSKIEADPSVMGQRSLIEGEKERAQRLSEQKIADAETAERVRREFGFGWEMQALAKTAKDIGLEDQIVYRNLIFLAAAQDDWQFWFENARAKAGADWELVLGAAKIAKRWHLTSVGINYDLKQARKYLSVETLMDLDVEPLTKARVAANEALQKAKQAVTEATHAFNAAYQMEDNLKVSKREHQRIERNELRLFGLPEQVDDIADLTWHYRHSELPV